MNLLLDTCTFLWFINADKNLPASVRQRIAHPDNEVLLSVVSLWEAAIKHQIGKLKAPQPVVSYLMEQRERHAVASLPLDEASLKHLEKLPPHHRDPFDRILICQATEHGLTLLTPDKAITQYPVKTEWD